MNDDQQRILRAMSPAQKIRAAEFLIQSARRVKAATMRAQHPEWSDEQVNAAVREAFARART